MARSCWRRPDSGSIPPQTIGLRRGQQREEGATVTSFLPRVTHPLFVIRRPLPSSSAGIFFIVIRRLDRRIQLGSSRKQRQSPPLEIASSVPWIRRLNRRMTHYKMHPPPVPILVIRRHLFHRHPPAKTGGSSGRWRELQRWGCLPHRVGSPVKPANDARWRGATRRFSFHDRRLMTDDRRLMTDHRSLITETRSTSCPPSRQVLFHLLDHLGWDDGHVAVVLVRDGEDDGSFGRLELAHLFRRHAEMQEMHR